MNLLRLISAAFAVAGVVVCSFVPVWAAESESPPPKEAASPATTDKDDEVVCRKIDVPGSRVSRYKVCKTRAEWAAEKAASSDSPKDE